ncbi:MAG: hypothetical protein AAGF26_11570, partial [Cyanobacteria bacterium P01_G01_bin.49]
SVLTIPHFSGNATIPQTVIQEVFIDGEFNEINQRIDQNIVFNFIYFPEIEESVIPNLNFQGLFLNEENNGSNQVTQQLNQTIFDLGLDETNLTNFGVDNFLNNDNVLDGSQFNLQSALLEGNSNVVTQKSQQEFSHILDLSQFDETTKNATFSELIGKILYPKELDSLQFGLQDTVIIGDRNFVSQTIEQTLIYSIITPHNFNFQGLDLDPIQFTIQETFINQDDNLINQTINQFINDVALFEVNLDHHNNQILSSNETIIEFDIETFINKIIGETTINAEQTNRQEVEIIGNDNTATQNNLQILAKPIPEPSTVKMLYLIIITGCLHLVSKISAFN